MNGNELKSAHMESANDDSARDDSCPDFDKTMPPAAFEALAVPGGGGICVLSTDPEFVATVRRISGAHQAIAIVEKWEALFDEVKKGHCGIALLDMEGAGGTLERRIAALTGCPAAPVIIAAARISEAPEPMRALTDRKIHRLLIKPAAPGNTRMVLEAAMARWQQLQQPGVIAAPADIPVAAARSSPPRRVLFLGGAGLALAAIAVGAFVSFGARDSSPVPAPVVGAPVTGGIVRAGPEPAPVSDAAPDPYAEQLAWADSALEVGLLAEPPHDNALEGYATILALDPGHERARAGLAATISMLFTKAEHALLDNSLELAANTLEQVRRVQPDHSRLAFLDTQLERARTVSGEPAAAPAAAVNAPASEVERLLGLSLDRLRRGQLISPPRDNAVAFFSRAAALDEGNAAVVETRATLRIALAAAAERALAAGEVEQVEPIMRALQGLGAATAMLADLDRRLSTVTVQLQRAHQDALLAAGLERLAEGRLAVPENDNAAFYLASLMSQNMTYPDLEEFQQTLTDAIAASIRESVAEGDLSGARVSFAALERIGADAALVEALGRGLDIAQIQAEFLATPMPAAELVLVTARAPAYPATALRNNVQGWVDLEFIVDRQGAPRDIVVTAAEPEDAFDRAATTAVARYRYEPFVMEGVTYERRARMRMRFALQD